MFRLPYAVFTPIALLSAGALLPLSAADAESFVSNGQNFEVRYGDLNLARKGDQRELRGRLFQAARKVCAAEPADTISKCRSAALAHVRAPVAAAIARAERGERLAVKDTETKVPSAH